MTRGKKVVGFLPLFAVLFLLSSGSAVAAVDMRPYYGPLMTEGNSWTYNAVSKGASFSETYSVLPGTLEIGGVPTRIFEVKKTGTPDEYARYHYSEGPDGFYYHALFTSASSSGGGAFTLSYIFDPPIKRYSGTASAGDRVQSSGKATYAFSSASSSIRGTLDYSSATSTIGFETVSVPEGTFNAIKTETVITMTGLFGSEQANLTNSLLQWLAPFIGIVKGSSTSSDGTNKMADLSDTNVTARTPVPDIKLNGMDGPLVLPPDTLLSLTVGLDAGKFAGLASDLWLIADAAQYGLFSYNYPAGWVSGISSVGQFPVPDFPQIELVKGIFPEGNYTFYVGVDTNPDGVPNQPLWFDHASLKIGAVGQTGAVSREEAIQKVLSEVITPAPDHTIVARMLKETLTPGNVINNAFSEDGEGRSTAEEEWFVWIDDAPYAFFSHPVRYVFVNRSTGAIEVQDGDEVPFLNGQPIWADPADFEDRSYWIFDNLDGATAGVSAAGKSDLKAAAPLGRMSGPEPEIRSAADNYACCIGKPKHKIALLLYNYDDGDLRADIESNVRAMADAFRENGYTVPSFPSSKENDNSVAPAIYLGDENGAKGIQQLVEFVGRHRGNEHCCDEIFIYYTGHGSRKAKKGETRYYFGLRSNYRGPNGDRAPERRLYAEDLAAIISGLGSCHINVIIDSCYSGGFISALGSVHGVETVRTSADPGEVAYGGYYDNVKIGNSTVVDPYPRSAGETGSEFTSGYARAIRDRANTGGASLTAHQLTDVGFTGAVANDVAAIAGKTHPSGITRIVPCNCCEETSYIGEYDTEYVVFSDPAGHAPYIGLPGQIRNNIATETISGASKNIQCTGTTDSVRSATAAAAVSISVTGPAPFMNVSGTLADNSFIATGTGTVAGYPNVSVKMTGSFDQEGALTGTYEMGTAGELPGGKSIIYYLYGSRR